MRRRLWVLAMVLLIISAGCEDWEKVLPQEKTPETEDSKEPENLEEIGTEEEETPEVEEQFKSKPETKDYIIKAGEQHAVLSFQETAVDTLRFKAIFDSSAIYTTINPDNQGDINKLYGVSDCGSYHHTNSARFGWRWYEGNLEIWAYTYKGGARKATYVDIIELDKFYTYEIQFSDNKYIFLLNEKKVELARSCKGTANGYKLFPYFGGDEKAPHEISIRIEELIN